MTVLGLVGIAAAVELDEGGRWVEDAPVEVDGGSLLLRSGVLFPIDGETGPAGFVFVGSADFTAPLASGGAALAVRAALGDGPTDGAWTEAVGRVVAVGHHPALLAAAGLGHPLGDDPATVSWRDDEGREQIEVTGLRPREALADARAALRSRAEALGGVGLDPDHLLALEAYRGGARRAIVEVEPDRDVRALIAAADDDADLVRPWLTWVVDPAGVVDDRYGAVLAVHGPTPDGRAWRVVSGVVREGAPEVTVARGAANVVLRRGVGVAAVGEVQVQVELTANAPTRLVDLWLPRSETSVVDGMIPVAGDPDVRRIELRRPGAVPQPVEVLGASFGPRVPREGFVARTLLLPESVDGAFSLRVESAEDWDLGQVLEVPAWVTASLLPPLPPNLGDLLQGLPAQITLGRVIAARPVLPVVSTDARPYPAELRAGTVVGGWQLTAGAGATAVPQGDGRLWTVTAPSTTTFSGGDLTESREGSYLGFPAVRLLAHTFVDGRIPERLRGVLNFYRTALPDYPYDEVVVLQEPDRPVLTVSSVASRIRTREDVRSVVPTIRSLGGGQLAIEALIEVPIGASPLSQLQTAVDSQWPHALERALAEAVAAGWWESLPWSDHDRWLARALPAVYRDRFVEEAWDEEVARRWDVFADERIAEGAPKGELAPLVGTDAVWSGEVGARLLAAVGERIGEEALLLGLHQLLDSGEPTLERLVTELEATGGVGLRDTFDAFAVAGLRPRIEGTTATAGDQVTVTLTASPPIGSYDVPLVVESRRGRHVAWVEVVDGRGTATLRGRGITSIDVDPDHLLPVRGERLREAAVGSN